jgi:hypothetical protein
VHKISRFIHKNKMSRKKDSLNHLRVANKKLSKTRLAFLAYKLMDI